MSEYVLHDYLLLYNVTMLYCKQKQNIVCMILVLQFLTKPFQFPPVKIYSDIKIVVHTIYYIDQITSSTISYKTTAM